MVFSGYSEALLLPEPVHAFVVDTPAFAAKAGGDVAAAPARVVLDELAHGGHEKHFLGAFLGCVALSGAVLLDGSAGPAFRHVVGVLETPGRIASARRA